MAMFVNSETTQSQSTARKTRRGNNTREEEEDDDAGSLGWTNDMTGLMLTLPDAV